jgi:hypothetical protein
MQAGKSVPWALARRRIRQSVRATKRERTRRGTRPHPLVVGIKEKVQLEAITAVEAACN